MYLDNLDEYVNDENRVVSECHVIPIVNILQFQAHANKITLLIIVFKPELLCLPIISRIPVLKHVPAPLVY